MKSAILLAIALVVLSSFPLVSHRDAAEAQEGARRVDANPVTLFTTTSLESLAHIGRSDIASATVGDPVMATTTEPVHAALSVAIPAGSRLVGHITDVRHDSGPTHASVNITFDRAELASGQSIAIHLDSGSRLVLGIAAKAK